MSLEACTRRCTAGVLILAAAALFANPVLAQPAPAPAPGEPKQGNPADDAERRRQEAEKKRQEAEKRKQEAEKKRQEAERQRAEAQKRKQEAEKQRQEAEKQEREAEQQRREAEKLEREAETQRLAAQKQEEAARKRVEAERKKAAVDKKEPAQPDTKAVPPAEVQPPPTPPAPGAPPAPAPPPGTAQAGPEAVGLTPEPAPTPAPAETPATGQAAAAELEKSGGPGRRAESRTLGLAPGAPQTATLPGGITPSFGAVSGGSQDWRFDFHGFVLLPLRVGLNERENPGRDQRRLVLHTPPRVPGGFETFEYTAVAPDPWVQLNFSYGNPHVTATVIVAARTVSNAESYFNPPDHIGINDAFLTFWIPASEQARFNVNVGGFANRYGNMGEYDLGRYGTPLIAAVSGMGVTATGLFDLGDIDIVAETGIQGQLTKTPVGLEPAGWNDFADPNVGTTFAPHLHGAVGYRDMVQAGLHLIHAFAQDDRATPTTQPDGNITVIGGDARLTLARFGHLYAGYAHTDANDARSVSGVFRILNAAGGPGLLEEYLGPNSGGRGQLDTFGAQYDFSLGNYLRYPRPFEGDAPDVVLSLFSILTRVNTPDDDWDDLYKLKYGGEVGYSLLSWFALAGRYDRVLSDTSDPTQTHAILTARTIFRTDFNSQDQVTLQYSRYLSGSGVTVKEGYPPRRDPTIEPDGHVISLMASMWW
jgi:hypothetical protein